MKKVAVVILNYNGKAFLQKFLPGIIAKTGKDAEIWIADNNSLDGSIEMLEEEFPDIQTIENPFNGGFSNGYNLALKQIEADYYVLLNSDIEVGSNWIKPVVELMETDELIAACQPKILSYYKNEDFEYAGAGGGFIDKYGYPFCRGRLFQSIEKDEGQYDDAIEVFWASGACMFIKADLFHKVGGLDGDFFAHMEEIVLCWRIKNEGYRIMYCPASTVYHVGGGTLPNSSARKTYLNFRNNFSLLYKNLPSNRLLPTFIARLVLDGAAGLKFLMQGGFQDVIAVIEAHLYFYRNIGKLRKKRAALKQNKVDSVYNGNIAFDHYLKRKKKFSELDPNQFS